MISLWSKNHKLCISVRFFSRFSLTCARKCGSTSRAKDISQSSELECLVSSWCFTLDVPHLSRLRATLSHAYKWCFWFASWILPPKSDPFSDETWPRKVALAQQNTVNRRFRRYPVWCTSICTTTLLLQSTHPLGSSRLKLSSSSVGIDQVTTSSGATGEGA